jgi:hypothetical protein
MISQPRNDSQYPERSTEYKQALKLAVQDLIEQAQQQGWRIQESIHAIGELIAEFRSAYTEDPDPAEDLAKTRVF